ncbi:hypothetical protein X801_07312 [Opisthorchis viverrini]|uniref:Uncharacterized protein n=1 Tax=Opisthorchis viverrini TaxID=6198 RepID=A0A1S8WR62_OPIVI|nr:hypothetical protein X801_07312 [Opisthorchis viverrini]
MRRELQALAWHRHQAIVFFQSRCTSADSDIMGLGHELKLHNVHTAHALGEMRSSAAVVHL